MVDEPTWPIDALTIARTRPRYDPFGWVSLAFVTSCPVAGSTPVGYVLGAYGRESAHPDRVARRRGQRLCPRSPLYI